MTTRAKVGVFKLKTYASYKEGSYDHTVEPHIVKEAMAKPEWLKAMKEEHDALIRNDIWPLVDPPPGCKPIGCKWVFKSKFNVDGSFQRHKARLVAKRYHQREGFGFKETFSLVIKPSMIRTVLSLVASQHWPIHQVDINNAFLHGDLQETVYMTQPPGFVSSDKHKVCKLLKALYGLKQAPRSWFHKLSLTLRSLEFNSAKSDISFVMRFTPTSKTYVLVYVDDIIITSSSSSEITSFIVHLNNKFSLKDLGPFYFFLDIEVKHYSDGGILLSQY